MFNNIYFKMLLGNLVDEDFFTKEEVYDLQKIFHEDNVSKFHCFMQKLMNDAITEEYIQTISVKNFREKLMQAIFLENFKCYGGNNISDSLVIEYDYVPSNNFVKNYMWGYSTRMKMFLFLAKHFDKKKYLNEISYLFNFICQRCTVNDVQQFIDNDYDIRELYNLNDDHYRNGALFNSVLNVNTDVIVILINNGLSFKKYEAEILCHCIRSGKAEHLQILINYGANMEILKNVNFYKLLDNTSAICKILIENNVDFEDALKILIGVSK